MLIQTEYEFTLPKGYVDSRGTLHRQGIMRLATALDEIEAMKHPGIKGNQDYLSVVLLSRVVSKLEGVD
ncbi:MAG: phage tail assembly protein, partial [Acetatifactor sp.]|nr:phage tail assembly protein [Acetatifactor sp.]